MSAMAFKRAVKAQSYLRMALAGPSGSGKTYTALTLATALAGDKPVAVIDTERGSASKYSDLFTFDVLELDSFHPDRYIEAIQAAQGAGYGVLVIDSITHEWRGVLTEVDRIVTLNKVSTIQAWAKATPMHDRFIDAMLSASMHIIVTMRSKVHTAPVTDEKGKVTVQKLGMEPVQRDGIEYEFDVVGDLDHDNTLAISKSRCSDLSGQVIRKPGRGLAEMLTAWLSGAPAPQLRVVKSEPQASPVAETAEDERIGQALMSRPIISLLVRLGHKTIDAQRDHLVATLERLDTDAQKATGKQLMAALGQELADQEHSDLAGLPVGTRGN